MSARAAPLSPPFPTLVQDVFCQRMMAQHNASLRTVAAYRDTFRLLLRYVQDHRHTAPTALSLPDLDALLVLAFLDHLERDRHNC